MYAKKKTLKLPPAEARWLDLKAAAAYLSCSVQSLRRRIHAGEVKAITQFGHLVVDKSDLDEMMVRNKKILPPYRIGNRPHIAEMHRRNRSKKAA